MMEKAELTPGDLDRVFAGARNLRASSDPSAELMGRVMRDALAAMPDANPAPVPENRARPMRRAALSGRLARFWSALSAGFGGGGVVASLGSVAVIAVVLGYTAPAGLAEDLILQINPATDDGIEIEPVAVYFLAGS